MHFKIVVLESPETKMKDFLTNLPYDDNCLNSHCDYYGEIYNSSDRKKVINADWFKKMWEGFATLDTKKQTVTFHDKETVTKSFQDYLMDLAFDMANKAENGELRGYELRLAADEYKGNCTLFYHNVPGGRYAQSSFDFFDDAKYMAGQTYRIGNIFDAHI